MRKLTIRGGLVATIAGYTTLLVLVVAACIAALYAGNNSLEAMYRDDTASLLHLKTSSERMLVLRERVSDVAQIISAGQPAKTEIAQLHTLLKQSNDELDAYARLHARDADEQTLFDTLQSRRRTLLDQVFLKAMSQLDQDNSFDFLDTHRNTPPALFTAYQDAIDALEAFQVARQKARYDAAGERFHRIVWAMAAVAAFALVIGFIAQRVLAKAIIAPIHLAVAQFDRISKGDLTGTVAIRGENEMAYLLGALKRMQDGLVETVTQVRASTETIVGDVRTIASGNVDLSTRTEQQAVSLQQAAASVEQLTATVRQNADNARDARTYAEGAAGIATRGGDAMQRVVETMSSISNSSARISGIVGVIESIAFQTNILALNAAVEAARAGEQGRGFAVVATEVRGLAQRCASAAKEIRELIGDSTQRVEDGSSLVALAGAAMTELVAAVERVNAIMGETSIAFDEQTSGIEQVNAAVIQMEQTMQRNAALVEEAAAAALSLEDQGARLSDAVAQFRLRESAAA
ncbi:Tar ligand binding domain-containing protein [Burkholderia sp. AU19243]|uniref:methyl-accepting chemotaxis protein n=1 Tax=Burkholderia sp. AU19243 TaxID=2824810 RepID=UPI001B99D121|nr:methyl-accepting chemotaxis protein [Burkholderia sp. AU19243]MBR7962945.1 Tar ligand binding domain-containing protein [Burkholderia vietnamiensis]MBR8142623.1 Tar ligand binding domain-containing protein [Burkholderia vietnamiensis]MBR8366452.1 Tar ligand binding domain-containing protein [Burkholderia sp. AU19243]